MRIAILSPSQNPYSETFIQAHKRFLSGVVYYYYGSGSQINLEGTGPVLSGIEKLKAKAGQILSSGHDYGLWVDALVNSFKKNKIDVILVEYGNHAFHMLPALSKCEIPFVVHFHGYDASKNDTIEKCNSYKEVFALASKVIAVSKVMEARLLKLGCPAEKLVYNVYGPWPEFHEVQASYDGQHFIAIGRFTDKKAPYYLILSFKAIANEFPNAKLIMAGDGGLYNTCINLVRQFKLEDKILFPGVISPETYRDYLQSSLAFVQHSITAHNGDQEGTPLAVLEASAAGLAIISTYHAGIQDVILHEQTGLLSDEHDVEAMSVHMRRILETDGLAKELGMAGKSRIKESFSLQRHIDALQQSLKEASSGVNGT